MDSSSTSVHFPALNANNNALALVDGEQRYTYAQLHAYADQLAAALLANNKDLDEARIALLLPAGLHYVAAMHGIWRAGGIAVPLNVESTVPELEHYLSSTGVSRLLTLGDIPAALRDLCERLGIQTQTVESLLVTEGKHPNLTLPTIQPERRALIIFTSGTTSKPKGVVSTHGAIVAQVSSLIEAWCWSDKDRIPLFLPLHHIHGIINVLSCALWSGATVHMYRGFKPEPIAKAVADGTFTLFMAVPTIYLKLLQHLETLNEEERQGVCEGFRAMRLNVCGSAACAKTLFENWRAFTGQTLLERYGMTELGMAIANPYHGERRAGAVGQALPGVQVKLVDESMNLVENDHESGEILVRGENVFLEYWGKPEATAESFVDGWFRTGDMAVKQAGYYRIIGRANIDIIKSGGYKLSALEIEDTLLGHPAIVECAVLGVEDAMWGESVVACVVLKEGVTLSLEELKVWCKERMSAYKIPKALHVFQALHRNAMGKVIKPELKKRLLELSQDSAMT